MIACNALTIHLSFFNSLHSISPRQLLTNALQRTNVFNEVQVVDTPEFWQRGGQIFKSFDILNKVKVLNTKVTEKVNAWQTTCITFSQAQEFLGSQLCTWSRRIIPGALKQWFHGHNERNE